MHKGEDAGNTTRRNSKQVLGSHGLFAKDKHGVVGGGGSGGGCVQEGARHCGLGDRVRHAGARHGTGAPPRRAARRGALGRCVPALPERHTIVIRRVLSSGYNENDLFDAALTYLATKINPQSMRRLCLARTRKKEHDGSAS